MKYYKMLLALLMLLTIGIKALLQPWRMLGRVGSCAYEGELLSNSALGVKTIRTTILVTVAHESYLAMHEYSASRVNHCGDGI